MTTKKMARTAIMRKTMDLVQKDGKASSKIEYVSKRNLRLTELARARVTRVLPTGPTSDVRMSRKKQLLEPDIDKYQVANNQCETKSLPRTLRKSEVALCLFIVIT
jgi:hypothetical protein